MRKILTALTITALLGACGDVKSYKPEPERKHFFHSVRQLPPEPVYNRLRWVYLPDPLPENPGATSAAPIVPTVLLEIRNGTVESAARELGSAAGYRTAINPEIGSKPFSGSLSGTVDEAAGTLARNSGIEVQVDHGRKELRFLPATAVAPRLAEGSDEHQSHY